LHRETYAKIRNYFAVRFSMGSSSSTESPVTDQSTQSPAPAPNRLLQHQSPKAARPNAQSLRSIGKPDLKPLGGNQHARQLFNEMLGRESKMANDWVVMYHSYTSSALVYEVQAAIASVLFGFGAEYGSLPRLLKAPFSNLPDARAVIKAFPSWPERDCCTEFKNVGICCSTSLVSHDPEATPTKVFLNGYAASTVDIGVLEKLLGDCGLHAFLQPQAVPKLAEDIMGLADKYGLPQASGRGLAGHLLQIFVHRTHVDKLAYASHPYGHPDGKRRPLSKHLAGPGPISGQTRLIVNPSACMRASAVRMYVCSADETFHHNRPAFHRELFHFLQPIIGSPKVRERAAQGIYGGQLPFWWRDLEGERQAARRSKSTVVESGEPTGVQWLSALSLSGSIAI